MQDTPPPDVARIPAKSRKQAMDWSLALASQGIQPVIDHGDDRGWGLIVKPDEHERSVAIIQQYRKENHHWPWRSRVFKGGPLFDTASLCWVLLTIIFFWFSGDDAEVRDAGIMDSKLFADGQWWRLFTATLLHADVAHLVTNAIFGFVLIGLAMGGYGSGMGMLAAFLAGAGGNYADYLIYPEAHRSLGASGVVTGALGLLTVESIAYMRHSARPIRFAIAAIAGGVMLFVLLGMSPDSDVVSHFGGFVTGIVLGSILILLPKKNRPFLNACSALIVTGLIIWSWTMAILH